MSSDRRVGPPEYPKLVFRGSSECAFRCLALVAEGFATCPLQIHAYAPQGCGIVM